jgi:hypothetical protein
MSDPDRSVTPAAQYRHPDGTVEVVYALEEGAVLTFREYPDESTFDAHLDDAEYLGEHPGVAALPGLDGAAADGESESGVDDEHDPQE